IKGLLNPQIDRAWYIPHLLQQRVRKLPVSFQVVADDLYVDGRRKTEVQNLAHDVGREERKRDAWKFICQLDPQIMYIFIGRVMVLAQGDKDVRVARSDRCRR